MAAGRVTLCFALALALVACSDDPDDGATPTTEETSEGTTTSTAPERPASTTTTEFDPASVEGQVEAAYLRSWDVYADAVYDLELDEEALESVYAEEGLSNIVEEIETRISEKRAAHVVVDHDYKITFTGEALASVTDQIRNHQVLIDPETKRPTELDPNEPQLLNFVMKRIDGEWRVALVERVDG